MSASPPVTEEKNLSWNTSGKWPKSLILLLVIGVAVHLVIFFGIRIGTPYLETGDLNTPFVQYIGRSISIENSDTLIAEQLILFDSEPLFLPTRWNHSVTPDIDSALPEARSIFEPYAPIPLLDVSKLDNILTGKQTDEIKPLNPEANIKHLLETDFPPLVQDFGKSEKPKKEVGPTLVLVVEDLHTGAIVSQRTIEDSTTAALTDDLWSGDSYLVWVDSTGQTDPMLAERGKSGISAEIRMGHFKAILKQMQLPTGYYRIRLTP